MVMSWSVGLPSRTAHGAGGSASGGSEVMKSRIGSLRESANYTVRLHISKIDNRNGGYSVSARAGRRDLRWPGRTSRACAIVGVARHPGHVGGSSFQVNIAVVQNKCRDLCQVQRGVALESSHRPPVRRGQEPPTEV